MKQDDNLITRLHDLMEQWRETADSIRPIDRDGAVAYLECTEELEQILNGDLSPIALWRDVPTDTKRLEWLSRHLLGSELRRLNIYMDDTVDTKEFRQRLDDLMSARNKGKHP
jgi:hypothetical protein